MQNTMGYTSAKKKKEFIKSKNQNVANNLNEMPVNKNATYLFNYTGLKSFWSIKFMKDFRRRKIKRKIFKKRGYGKGKRFKDWK